MSNACFRVTGQMRREIEDDNRDESRVGRIEARAAANAAVVRELGTAVGGAAGEVQGRGGQAVSRYEGGGRPRGHDRQLREMLYPLGVGAEGRRRQTRRPATDVVPVRLPVDKRIRPGMYTTTGTAENRVQHRVPFSCGKNVLNTTMVHCASCACKCFTDGRVLRCKKQLRDNRLRFANITLQRFVPGRVSLPVPVVGRYVRRRRFFSFPFGSSVVSDSATEGMDRVLRNTSLPFCRIRV
jgi:hypothetical protein